MTEHWLTLLACCGATMILTRARLFRWFHSRRVDHCDQQGHKPGPHWHPEYPYCCTQCAGCWLGAIGYLLLERPTDWTVAVPMAIAFAFAASLVSYVAACIAHAAGDP